jgi:DNA-binding NarL/FixJ family response regulator
MSAQPTGASDGATNPLTDPLPRGNDRRPRVAIVNDYELVVRGLAGMLAPFAHRIEVADAIVIDEPVPNGPVDVALYDTFGRPGVERDTIERLVRDPSIGRVAIYSFDHSADELQEALDAGASAYLSKATPAEPLVDQLERVAAGKLVTSAPGQLASATTRSGRAWPGQELGLSEREAEVAVLAALGQRNADISQSLCIGVDTVKTHLRRAFRKVGVRNRTELSVLLRDHPTFRRLAMPPDAQLVDGLLDPGRQTPMTGGRGRPAASQAPR